MQYLQQGSLPPNQGYLTNTVLQPTNVLFNGVPSATSSYHLSELDADKGRLGKPSSMIDAANIETTFTYDAKGRLTQTTRAGIDSSTTTYYTSSEYDLSGNYKLTGRIKEVEDALANITHYDYGIYPEGAFGYSEWVEKRITYQNHGTADEIETYTIVDALGRTLESSSPKGIVTKNEYDDEGRLRKTATLNENGVEVTRSWYWYNPDGTKRLEQVQYSESPGVWLSARTTSYTYDLAGRLIRTNYPDGTFTATRYWPEKDPPLPPLIKGGWPRRCG